MSWPEKGRLGASTDGWKVSDSLAIAVSVIPGSVLHTTKV